MKHLLIAALLAAFACGGTVSTGGDVDGGNGDGDGGMNGDGGGGQACGVEGNDLIYVVDQDYRLLSFDPREIDGTGAAFSLVGNLNCPAGSSWSNWGGGDPATPFSMSVDRMGNAWVLYTSGEIFKVSITNASCQASGFQKGQMGFELFGMGYVSDSPGSAAETLFLAGGSAAQSELGNLGSVDGTTLGVATIGALPTSEHNPEMTGTGNAELYGYFPGSASTFVAKLSKTDSTIVESWPLAALGGSARAWAFAHWGGKFYMFITTQGVGLEPQVKVLDPTTGMETVAIANSPYVVVGAGVSTCAPIVVE